jgi:Bacterial Ig-like domain (group 3)/FG-GAP-like repeat
MKTALCLFFLSLSAFGQTVSFTTPKNYYGGVGCTYTIVGDWNGDGKMDIGCVSPGGVLTTHLGNGDGTFQHYVQTKWPYQSAPVLFRISTTNQTGLAVYNGSYGVDIWLPTSTGSFYYNASLYPNYCFLCDNPIGWSNVIAADFNFNGDGFTDLAFGEQSYYCEEFDLQCNSWGEIDEFPGNGDGTFGFPLALYDDGGGPGSLLGANPRLMWVNNTLITYSSDMWRTKYTYPCPLSYQECWFPFRVPGAAIGGYGNWKFLPSSLSAGPVLWGAFKDSLSFPQALYLAYNNGNTQLDVFANFFTNRTRIGSTTVPGIFNQTSANQFDSHLDLAGTYTDPDGNTGVAIFFGNGKGTFNPDPLFIRNPSGYASQSIYVADFNGDNKLDIVSAMASSTKPDELEVLLNSSNPKTPTVSVASSLNPSTDGETVTFTATVEPNPLNWPTESVIFYSGTTELAKVQLVNGTASVSTAKLEPGTHTITAAYSGDCCDYLPGSASMSQVVNK